MYLYYPPLIRSIHKCSYVHCKRKLNKVPKEDIVAEMGFEGEVLHYYCNADCARAQYDIELKNRHKEDTLNDYIEGRGKCSAKEE